MIDGGTISIVMICVSLAIKLIIWGIQITFCMLKLAFCFMRIIFTMLGRLFDSIRNWYWWKKGQKEQQQARELVEIEY